MKGTRPPVAFPAALLLLAAAADASAQFHKPAPLSPLGDTSSSEALNNSLFLDSPVQRELLLRGLGLDPALAREAAAQKSDTGLHFDETEGSGLSLLFVPCTGPGSPAAHLFLLRPAPGHRLRVADDAPLDCWWKPANYGLVRVPGRPAMAVLAHHANAGHGTGFVEENLLLLEARGSRWATLLKTPEYQSEEELGTGKTVERSSTLQPFPDGSIEETRATTLHKAVKQNAPDRARLATVERRRWLWDQTLQAYRPGAFGSVCR